MPDLPTDETSDSAEPIRGRSIEDLRTLLEGAVIQPGDETYDEARAVWNGLIDKYPAVIIKCASVPDIVTAVEFARGSELPFAVKSGGHDFAGHCVCDDGLVIDLSQLNAVEIFVDDHRASVEAGVTWGEFYEEAVPHGVATPGGALGVGVAGFTLGGGYGLLLSRKHGLTVDNLRSAEVVTAAGEVVEASPTTNSDLFWALRGGSGNFGIVTSFEYQLHDVPEECLSGYLVFPFDDGSEVLRCFRDEIATAPDELTGFAVIMQVPEFPMFPEDVHGETVVALSLNYVGDIDKGEHAIAPFRSAGEVIVDTIAPKTYLEIKQGSQGLCDHFDRFYSKAQYLAGLPDQSIETLLTHTAELPGNHTMVALGAMGGAITRVDSVATAFPHRDAAFELYIWPEWSDPDEDEAVIEWAGTVHDAMSRYSTGGVYVNMLSHDEGNRVPEAYGQNHQRLAELKAKWDPNNLFRLNHNIPPANGT